jgi:lipid-binding SYLF domain-containing protein
MNGITVALILSSILTFTPFALAATQTGENQLLQDDPTAPPSFQEVGQEAETTVRAAEKMLRNMQLMPDRRIPSELLNQAAAVAVIPEIRANDSQGEMMVSNGILIAQHAEGWSLPVFIGFHRDVLGSEKPLSEGLVLVFNHTETIRQLVDGFDFILGSDATIAAGPTEQDLSAASDAQIMAYSPSGPIDEAMIQGASLTIEGEPLAEFYNLNRDAVREYFGEEEQLIRQFLGLDQEISPSPQGIDDIPESATVLQENLMEHTGTDGS